eukprot:2414456-Pleurochrysis_carterae.AAC.1
MNVIILRSVASINSGAMMYLFASSAVRGGKLKLETKPTEDAGAAAPDAADVAADCACDRVWRDVA